jgi:hypothetical protein
MKWWPLLALIVSPLVSAVTLDELQQRFTEQRWCARTSIKPAR